MSNHLLVRTKDDIRTVLDQALTESRAKGTVFVTIPEGNSDLLRRTRAALDMMVTREEITEDEARDIRFGYAKAAPAVPAAPPVPTTTKQADAPVEGDPRDFLNSDVDDEVLPDVKPPVEVEDNDFLLSEPAKLPSLDNLLSGGPDLKKIFPPVEISAEEAAKMPAVGDGPVTVRDELDRAVPTDEPVRVVDTEPEAPAMPIPATAVDPGAPEGDRTVVTKVEVTEGERDTSFVDRPELNPDTAKPAPAARRGGRGAASTRK